MYTGELLHTLKLFCDAFQVKKPAAWFFCWREALGSPGFPPPTHCKAHTL